MRLYKAWLQLVYGAEDTITRVVVDGKGRAAYLPAQFPTTTETAVTEVENEEGDGTLEIRARNMFVDVPIFNNLLDYSFKTDGGLNRERLKRLMIAILCFSYFEVVKYESREAVDRHQRISGYSSLSNRDVESIAQDMFKKTWASASQDVVDEDTIAVMRDLTGKKNGVLRKTILKQWLTKLRW